MPAKKNARCQRCGRRLKKGGDNYRLECAVVADFDGFINTSVSNANIEKIANEIADSELTEDELHEQVYFALRQKLCHDCCDEVVRFLKGNEIDER